MTAIVDFITARLDEDEQAALAAQKFTNATPWRFVLDSYGGHHRAGSIEDEPLPEVAENEIAQGVGEVAWGQHITLHDPVRVLQQTTALRRAVEAEIDNRIGFDGELCACEPDEVRAGECERWTPERSELLRALASAWSDHPDYQKEWKP